MAPTGPLTGPDLEAGVEISKVPAEGMLLGHAHGLPVLLIRKQDETYAVGARCSHYSGPLVEGVLDGHELRCPWHHACFDVRTGEALAPPALDALPCWHVERRGVRLFVAEPLTPLPKSRLPLSPANVVIVGAGAAGSAAAETLRQEGYPGAITLIGEEPNVPIDRPNLSKDYLAGSAQPEWLPLRDEAFYQARQIDLLLGNPVVAIDPSFKLVELSDGSSRGYGSLLLATGAAPIKLTVPGSNRPHVHSLRSLANSDAIIASAQGAKHALVVGSSFIGLEVAASLRTRGLQVDLVSHDTRPLEHVLGPELGDFVRSLHERHGVRFHLPHRLKSIQERSVTLDDGNTLKADLVVAGIGVRPSLTLAEKAGLRVDRGVLVDELLETSVPGIYAAGDIARWRSPRSPNGIRVEHWVVAQRQGQTAARNILGQRQRFRAVPFFWSQHYDVQISYVGYADRWQQIEVAGSIEDKCCLVAFRAGGRIAAVASIGRDQDSLRAEALLATDDQAGLEALVASAT